ncbi:MAG: hypothetical protein K2M06_06915 [Muribaculaceae bacterium]|nr:hypothetical protein [Muribaculaceae bacterium]
MLLFSFLHSVEFYVLAVVLAAAVVAAVVKPREKGPARTWLYGGTLLDDGPGADGEAPSISICMSEDGRELVLERRGLAGVNLDDGAYSVAVEVAGFDVTVNERLDFGSPGRPQATGAEVRIDCLGLERYHFLYRSKALGRNCAFTVSLRPSTRVERPLV